MVSSQDIGRWVYSVWLFTFSDIKTIIVPTAVSGMVIASQPSRFALPHSASARIPLRLPAIILWCWINLLPFTIDNQRQLRAIKEDSINKPWRPLPAKIMSLKEAKVLTLILYPTAVYISYILGGLRPSLALVGFGHSYNNLGGSDRGIIIRNLINAAGYSTFVFGAVEAGVGGAIPLTQPLTVWLAIISLIVATTVHTQDMSDQMGDKARGRRTVPIVIGDTRSRWSIAILVLFWSVFVPSYWESTALGHTTILSLGCTIAKRTLWHQSIEDDKMTFRVWNIWMILVYLVPLL